MSKNYIIECSTGITRAHFLHRPTCNDVKAAIDDMAEHYPYEKRLRDLSNIKSNLKIYEIDDIAEHGKNKFIKRNKLAIIAPDDSMYNEMRIFEAFRAQQGHANVRVYRNESEAIEWLNK